MDYPKLISEKWNLTAKFNCPQAIYFYAPSALAVPMCGSNSVVSMATNTFSWNYKLITDV